MSCPTHTLPLTPAQFTATRERLLTDYGIQIDPLATSGEISHLNAKVQWSYNGSTLALTVISKPFILSCEKVAQMVERYFA